MSKEMSTKNQMNYTQKISKLNKLNNLPDTSSLKSEIQWNNFISNFKKIMKQELVDHQKSPMKTNKKLTFYSIFKTENKKAKFLDYIKNPHYKKITTKQVSTRKPQIKNRNRSAYSTQNTSQIH